MGVLAHGSMWMGRRTQHNPQHPDEQDLGRLCKGRLEELLAFAQVYRGWTAKELAAFIGRDVHNVVPPSGIPKADLVLRLAQALDWNPGSVFEHICGGPAPEKRPLPTDSDDYRQLNREAYRAFEEGRFEDMIALGLRMERVADSPDQRAEACLRQWGGWDGLGRYEQAIDSLQRGLRESAVSVPLLLRMRGNLAINYFVLGKWLEAEGVATAVLREAARDSCIADAAGDAIAAAYSARGLALRSRAFREVHQRQTLAEEAVADLRNGERSWEEFLSKVEGPVAYSAAARICLGGALTSEVLAGRRAASAAVSRIMQELDTVVEVSTESPRNVLEALGWWCVFGAELVLDSASGSLQRDQLLGQLTLKGHELADATNNWALRERMLTIEYLRWTSRRGTHSEPFETSLDREDVQALAGAMARFPGFRPFGWELIRHASRTG